MFVSSVIAINISKPQITMTKTILVSITYCTVLYMAHRCTLCRSPNFIMNDFALSIVRKPHQSQRHLTAIVDTNQVVYRGAQEGKSSTTFAFPSILVNYSMGGGSLQDSASAGMKEKQVSIVQIHIDSTDLVLFLQ